MRRDGEIKRFLDSLTRAETPDDRSVNIYRNAVRCANLMRWFSGFDDTYQSVIFVGEAPGRDGGAITGIPFVSPMVLTSANDPWGEFGMETQYELPVGQDANHRERTATRFWKHVPPCFSELPRPLTWNVYPFWPFEVGGNDKRINRAPAKGEIGFGARWLAWVVEMYPNAQVVAVGVKARDTLESIGIDAPLVPHPSRGSDEKLIKSLERVAEKLRADMDRE
ncbi:MAG: hypothetical protein F4Y88_00355 [Chloroflexi bacterium]|nr:hypothetical protein [Chloroflexota bacterium]